MINVDKDKDKPDKIEIEIVGYSEMHPNKHVVALLKKNERIGKEDEQGKPQILYFETWACMHRKCNYLEYRLQEGHRNDR